MPLYIRIETYSSVVGVCLVPVEPAGVIRTFISPMGRRIILCAGTSALFSDLLSLYHEAGLKQAGETN